MFLHLHYLILLASLRSLTGVQFKQLKEKHRAQQLSSNQYDSVVALGTSGYQKEVLDNILIPRVVGTENHTKVQRYIVDELQKLGWTVDIDAFVDPVPIFGELSFANIIATPNPRASRFLVLACHYDSKYFPREYFVGATDSAVPCAMLLDIAKSLNSILNTTNDQLNLKLVFFDGEEAFENWGPHDSIYGAKHLAKRMHSTYKSTIHGESFTDLDGIDMLVLLDLLGARDPVFINHFDSTKKWFKRLSKIEEQLKKAGLLRNHRINYFRKGGYAGGIEDDHIPFLRKGVPILHLIATPFPPEWHTPRDNIDIVDFDTVDNLTLILKIFVVEYLHLKLEETNKTPKSEL